MRDDLLDAQASVDWAETQLKPFAERIESWLGLNVDIRIEDTPPPATHNVIVAVEKAFLPRSFNVEFGAYVNAIRSSLDILATALANRYGVCKPEDAYFPVVNSQAIFASGRYKGSKLVNGLPSTERMVIESLKPYKGGNEPLFTLHHLDVIRKHRRLIDVDILPTSLSIGGRERIDFVPVAIGSFRVNEKTILGLLPKGGPNYKFKFVPRIALSEPGSAESKQIIASLRQFASLASSIIKLFDA